MSHLFEKIITNLLNDSLLDQFKFRKNESSLVMKTQEGRNVITFDHWKNFDSTKMVISIIFGVRLDVVMKWFEKFNFKSLRDQRERCSFYSSENTMGKKGEFEFLLNGENYDSEFFKLHKYLTESISAFFSKYSTPSAIYDKIVAPVLKGESNLPKNGSDWIFIDLALCKLANPHRLHELEKLISNHSKAMFEFGEPNVSLIYPKLQDVYNFLESGNIEMESFKRMKSNSGAANKSKYTVSEKQNFVEQAIKIIEIKYSVKRSGWARWITKDGYIFEIRDDFNPIENNLYYEIKVKPIYVDNLLWKILGDEKEIKPFSLRINGALAVSGIVIFDYKWTINGDDGYIQENLITLLDNIYSDMINNISAFISKYPNPDTYYYEDSKGKNKLITILMLCHHNRFHEAMEIIGEEVSEHRLSNLILKMPDGKWKDSYEFIIEYCKNFSHNPPMD